MDTLNKQILNKLIPNEQSFQIKEGNYNDKIIQTPFFDSSRDVIVVYLYQKDDKFYLSDYGEAIGNLLCLGFENFDSQLDEILLSYQVKRRQGMLIKEIDSNHSLLELCQAMIAISFIR